MNRVQSVTAIALLSLAASTMGQNLISDPGFESGGSGWTLFTQSGSVAVGAVTYPSTGARTGTRYARVEVTTPAASSAENWHIQFQPPTGWEAGAGASYELKFWAKSDSSRPIHVSVQGSDYAYLTGTSFGLTPDWTEYTVNHTSEAEGVNGIRFHIYVAEGTGVYSFDDFTLTQLTASIRSGAAVKGSNLQVREGRGAFLLSLDGVASQKWTAELLDLHGRTLASSKSGADGSLRLAHPNKSGVYFIRANTASRSWVRKVSVQ